MRWICANCKSENPDGGRFCIQCGTQAPTEAAVQEQPAVPAGAALVSPAAAAFSATAPPVSPLESAATAAPAQPQVATATKKGGKGLIIALVIAAVLLIGFCVLGIIAAIAIPNFLSAKERAKQARSVAEVRVIATALQAYHADKNGYPPVNQSDTETYGLGTVDALESYLVPDYIRVLPKTDGWGHSYLYGANRDASSFIVMSLGSDGEQGTEGIPEERVATNCFQDDILWKDDAFLQEPEGKQRNCK